MVKKQTQKMLTGKVEDFSLKKKKKTRKQNRVGRLVVVGEGTVGRRKQQAVGDNKWRKTALQTPTHTNTFPDI